MLYRNYLTLSIAARVQLLQWSANGGNRIERRADMRRPTGVRAPRCRDVQFVLEKFDHARGIAVHQPGQYHIRCQSKGIDPDRGQYPDLGQILKMPRGLTVDGPLFGGQ